MLQNAVEKRDRVGQFLAHLKYQWHLPKLRSPGSRSARRSSSGAIEQFGRLRHPRNYQFIQPDGKGKYPKLEGETVTLSIKDCPASVGIAIGGGMVL